MISLEHVSRTFGAFRAVDDVSLSVPTGQILGLLGPNGAGKTTTMRMITGFLAPTSGSISIDGVPVIDNPEKAKQRIGYMPESAPLYSDMIVDDYLHYIAGIQGVDPEARIPYLVKTCGLSAVMHKNISDLSRGYRQRVGLAHALMHDPEILILDEPTSGLDPNQIIEVRNLIKNIGTTRTVIISTHILSEVETLCDRIVIISGGRIVADSPRDELRTRYGGGSILTLVLSGCDKNEPEKALNKLKGVSAVLTEEIRERNLNLIKVSLTLDTDAEVRPAVYEILKKKDWVLYSMNLERNSLEDIFKKLTTGGES